MSTAQIKKLKAKMKAEKDAAAKAGGVVEAEELTEAKPAAATKPAAGAKGKKGAAKGGPGAAIAEKLRA